MSNQTSIKVILLQCCIWIVALSNLGLAQVNPSDKRVSSVKKTIPAPPPLIAPTELLSSETQMLSPDQAQAKEKEYKAQADQEYARGDYGRAQVSLQKAYLVSKNPRYIANQGLVLEKMKRYSDAIKALEYYLITEPAPEMARSAQQVINRLRPEVKIITDPPGAQVMLGNINKGQTPLTFRLIAGEHPLELILKNYDTRRITLFVTPGKPVFAQYKLDQSMNALSVETTSSKKSQKTKRPPMNTLQSSSVILGSLSLGLSATSFWLTRSAIVERNSAPNQLSWELAQSEAELFSSLSYTTAGIGFSALVGGLTWWLFSSPEQPRMLDPINKIPLPPTAQSQLHSYP